MSRTYVPSGNPASGISQAVRAGSLIFVSGQLAIDDQGNLVGENDCRAQAVQCFHNIEQVLAAAGASLRDVVQITAFIAHPDDVEPYRSVRNELFEHDPPAATTVLASPVRPQYLLEVQVIAEAPG